MMKTFFVACAFLLSTFLPLQAARPTFLGSVVGVQMIDPSKPNPRPTMCTAGRVGQDLYLTAYHCVDDKAHDYLINHHTADLLAKDEKNDLALLKAVGHTGPSIPLAEKGVSWGDEVQTAGRPLGGPLHFFRGHVARPSFTYEGQEYVIFDMPVAGGQSGSPIVNGEGKLVSVMQIGIAGLEPYADISGGVSFKALKAFLRGWI